MKTNSDIGQDQPSKASKPLIKSMKKVRSPPFLNVELDGFDFNLKWRVNLFVLLQNPS